MADDQKPLTGKEERLMRAIERVLAARSRREQPGVKITNLASGKVQVEVHAYDDDLTAAGDRARAEFDRQLSQESVDAATLERMRWLATIGQAHLDQQGEPDETTRRMLAERDEFLAKIHAEDVPEPVADEIPNVHDIAAGPGKRRRSVAAVGDDGPPHTPTVDALDEMMAKLREVQDSGVEGVQVRDA